MIGLDNTIGLTKSAAVLALVAIAYASLASRERNPARNGVVLGLLFGAFAVAAMYNPITVVPGVIMDMRDLAVGLAGAFVGPIALVVTLLLGEAARLHIGGEGAIAGMVGMVIAGLMGLLWSRLVKPHARLQVRSLVLLALMIWTNNLSLLMLPVDAEAKALTVSASTVLLLTIAGTLGFGLVLKREERMHWLMAQAHVDPLTNLLNRRGFDLQIERTYKPSDRGSALAMIDLDRFKSINDDHGHSAGDEVLKEAASRLTKSLRATDVIARFGGEEFLVFLPEITLDQSRALAEKLRRNLKAGQYTALNLEVTASIGLCWRRELADPMDALDCADACLREAKEQGRDRVVTSGPTGEMGNKRKGIEALAG